MTNENRRPFLPAMGRDWLLPLYDPWVKLLGGDAVRAELVEQAGIRPHDRLLDVGCGTGTLVLLIRRRHPDAEVVGLDPDPHALALARRKAARAGRPVRFDQGYADELPYPAASFDRVFSSFMFHHLRPNEQEKTLREVLRVLKPGGALHLLDFAGEESSHPRGLHGLLSRLFHHHGRPGHGHDRSIPVLISEAGFEHPQELARRATFFGRVTYFAARRGR